LEIDDTNIAFFAYLPKPIFPIDNLPKKNIVILFKKSLKFDNKIFDNLTKFILII